MARSHGRRTRDAYRGCLLGGALGDALGAPVEFMRLSEIQARFGRAGVAELESVRWPAGSVTDDTQLTLFTAEALLREAHRDGPRRGDRPDLEALAATAHASYLRWLSTQDVRARAEGAPGWLVHVRELHARRAPGNTCLAALRSGVRGTRPRPVNDSKGCGGVMRSAPVGLACRARSFEVGCELAAVTHGHPTGQLAAGALAAIVAALLEGEALRGAAEAARDRCAREPGGDETAAALDAALARAARGEPSAAQVESLGQGWVAEEALAIGLYCALVARDVEHGLLLAVNHGGDSDSTGSIAGNLLGLVRGEGALPGRWLARLELREVIAAVADDLWEHFGPEHPGACADRHRYPP